MMHGVIREVCALSVFCGLAMSIMPEGSVKRVAGVLCTAALLITVLTPLRDFDMDSYALLLAKYKADYLATDTFNHRVEIILRDAGRLGATEQIVELLEKVLQM